MKFLSILLTMLLSLQVMAVIKVLKQTDKQAQTAAIIKDLKNGKKISDAVEKHKKEFLALNKKLEILEQTSGFDFKAKNDDEDTRSNDRLNIMYAYMLLAIQDQGLSHDSKKIVMELKNSLKTPAGKEIFEEMASVGFFTHYGCAGRNIKKNVTCSKKDFKEMANARVDALLKTQQNIYKHRRSPECLGADVAFEIPGASEKLGIFADQKDLELKALKNKINRLDEIGGFKDNYEGEKKNNDKNLLIEMFDLVDNKIISTTKIGKAAKLKKELKSSHAKEIAERLLYVGKLTLAGSKEKVEIMGPKKDYKEMTAAKINAILKKEEKYHKMRNSEECLGKDYQKMLKASRDGKPIEPIADPNFSELQGDSTQGQ